MDSILRLQRWWHVKHSFVRPVQRKCALRPVIARAGARIAAVILGWWTRKKLRLRLDCHHVMCAMRTLQKDLGRAELLIIIRLQAHVRGFLARKRTMARKRFMAKQREIVEQCMPA